MRAWARTEAPDVDLERETAKFRDHQFRQAYTDWPAVWRNWMRRAHDGTTAAAIQQPAPRQSRADRYAQTIAELTGRNRQPEPETIDVTARESPARRLG